MWPARSRRAASRFVVLSAGLIACSDATAPVRGAMSASVVQTQTATAGHLAPTSPIVLVADQEGHPLPDVTVAFTVVAGGGHVTAGMVTTDAMGHATTDWTLGTSVGTNTLRASAEGFPSVSFTAYGFLHPTNPAVDQQITLDPSGGTGGGQQITVDSGGTGIAVSRNDAVFAALLVADEVAQIDPTAMSVFRSVQTSSMPFDVAFDPSGMTAYVATGAGTIDVVSVALGTRTATITVPGQTDLRRVLVDSTYVYVTSAEGVVTAIVPGTGAVAYTTSVGGILNGIAHHPTQPLVYVTSNGGSLTELDVRTGHVLRSLPLTGGLQEVAIDASGQTLYVANEAGGVYVVDQGTLTVTGYIDLPGDNPFGLAVTRDNTQLYVVSSVGTISIVDRGTNTVTKTISVGSGVRRIAFDHAGSTAFVSSDLGVVVVIR